MTRLKWTPALLAGAFLMTSCSSMKEQPAVTEAARAPVVVTSVKPVRKTIFRRIELPGTVEALWSTRIYAKIPGYLEEIKVDYGDHVRKGQLLAVLVSPEMDHELSVAVADYNKALADVEEYKGRIALARAHLDAAKEQAGLAEVTLTRWRNLDERLPGLVAQQQIDTLSVEKRTNEAKTEAARQELTAAGAALEAINHKVTAASQNVERLRELAGYLRITAPFNGVVTRRFVDPGMLVQSASGSSTQASPIVELQDPSILRVKAHVPETDVPSVSVGRRATLTVDALPGRTFEGIVDRHSFAEDPDTRTMLVEFRIPNRSGELRPGMYGHISLSLERHVDALTVPSTAVIPDKKGAYVYIAVDGKVKKVRPELGADDGIDTEILNGIKGSDEVLIPGQTSISDGDPVQAAPARRGDPA